MYYSKQLQGTHLQVLYLAKRHSIRVKVSSYKAFIQSYSTQLQGNHLELIYLVTRHSFRSTVLSYKTLVKLKCLVTRHKVKVVLGSCGRSRSGLFSSSVSSSTTLNPTPKNSPLYSYFEVSDPRFESGISYIGTLCRQAE